MLQLDISFLLYCFVFLPKALPVAPSPPPPDRHPNYFLTIFPPTNSCELNHFPSTGRGCFFVCSYLRARSLSLSLVFPCLSYLAVCVSVPRECRCWTSSVLASVGPEGVFVRVRFFFFLPSGRGVGLLRAYSMQRQPGGCAD